MQETDGEAVADTTQEFVADREDGAAALEAVLEADDGAETWTFDDIELDSGTFGELVSQGIVEKIDGEYRLADPAAVRQVIGGDEAPARDADSDEGVGSLLEGVGGIDSVRNAVVGFATLRTLFVALALTFVGAVRTVPVYGDVHRDGLVVLPGNDPYRYRYWLEQLVASDLQPWNPGDLGAMPSKVATGDVFYYWLAWLGSALLGNSADAVATVLTWYPVLAAMGTGLVIYALAMRLTGDVRIGIASVCILALIPIHSTYTSLGFGDHHALDYLLLTLVVSSLVVLVDRDPTVRLAGTALSARWVGAIGLGLALAAQNAAWRGGPIWLIGIGLYVLVQTIADVTNDRSPLAFGGPVLAAIGLSALVTGVFWAGFDWLEQYRAVAPVLLLVGSAVVIAGGEAARGVNVSTRAVVAGEVGIAGLVAVIAWLTMPAVSETGTRALEYFQRTGGSGITETASLFSAEFNVLFGPVIYLGSAFVLAVPFLGWATWTAFRSDHRGWGAVATISWYLLVWTAIQLRFAAELAPFVALFAGVGFVALLSWIELIDPATIFQGEAETESKEQSFADGAISRSSLPSPSRSAYIVGGFLLLSSFSLIFVPSHMADVTAEESTVETATWLEEYSDEQGYEYPQNYVFSPWSDNLRYNYFVNGESASYAYAQANYEDFVSASNPDDWYQQLQQQGRFVVTHDIDGTYPASSTQAMLHDRLGSRGNGTSGAGHYRALSVSDDRGRAAFELVPGARLTGGGPANETITVETDVEIDGETFTYERQVETNRYGDYGVTVPYADEYETAGETRAVTANDIESGTTLGQSRAHWAFDEGGGETIRDPVGGDEATLDGAEWVDGVNGSALQFDGTDSTVVRNDRAQDIGNDSFSVAFWVKGDLEASGTDFPTVLRRGGEGGYGFWARSSANDFGIRVDDTEGTSVRAFGIEDTSFEEWTLITAVVDRDQNEIRLYRDRSLVMSRDASDLGQIADSGPLSIGGRPNENYATASVDSVQIYSIALENKTVRRLHDQNRTYTDF
ncbi:LamG-like jellyroll fold domain-containing protein [Natrinema thermotolerans]